MTWRSIAGEFSPHRSARSDTRKGKDPGTALNTLGAGLIEEAMVDDVKTASRRHGALRERAAHRGTLQRREEADLGALVGRGADPRRASADNVLALQRKAGNRATTQLLQGQPVQRALGKVARAKWQIGARPKTVKGIDVAVAALADKMAKLPGAYADIKKLIVAVHKAIADFRASKYATGKWANAVTALEVEVQTKEANVDANIARKQKGQDRYDVYTTLETELAKYAKRTNLTPANFEDDPTGPTIASGLAAPRGAGGALTDQAVADVTAGHADEIAREKADREDATFAGMKVEDLRGFMAAHTNALTGRTMYPELRNLTDPNGKTDAVVTSAMDLGGVTMQVEHNASDVNLDERLKLIKEAVEKITTAGIKVPPLKLHLPKYGRGLKVNAKADAPGGGTCLPEEVSSRAVFVAPDFMHLSSEVIGNPLLNKATNPATGKEEYVFSSTSFDPTGVATIVHEFGHAIHFMTQPAKFQGLWGSQFTGKTPSGKLSQQVALAEVSQYGQKPREFVAEVFLGLVYGKTYSEDVMSMYRSFGGPIPPAVTIKAAAQAM
jgi:hypothetical protein